MAKRNRIKILSSFLISFASATCPDGFTESVDGVSCLKFVSNEMTQKNAEDHCKGLGGHLVSVGSQERNNEV